MNTGQKTQPRIVMRVIHSEKPLLNQVCGSKR